MNNVIYIATRLFDIEEKIKAERLECAVLDGIKQASQNTDQDLPADICTFVPFRDSNQDSLTAVDKTRILFDDDINRMQKAIMLVAYIDGLSKDEGVCFEIGFAYAKKIPILLILTDFISHQLPSGQSFLIDPLISESASAIVLNNTLPNPEEPFHDYLLRARAITLENVTQQVTRILLTPTQKNNSEAIANTKKDTITIFVEFGGELFEWQSLLADKITSAIQKNPKLASLRSSRYGSPSQVQQYVERSQSNREWIEINATQELRNIEKSDIVIICSDMDESPSGSAFIQGYATGLNKTIWLYNSKSTKIIGPGGYVSSRNLMLDYSASKVFKRLDHVEKEIENLRLL